MQRKDKFRRVIELMTKKVMKEYLAEQEGDETTEPQEPQSPVDTEGFDEIVDDIILMTDMHIQQNYGNMDVKQFRQKWIESLDNMLNPEEEEAE